MKKIDTLTQEFKIKLEKFITGCDALEELDNWDLEEYGEMDAFYQNDLVSVIIRLIAVDGNISENEVKYLNENFGFSYTVEELKDVYHSCSEEISHSFDEQFKNGISMMRAVNGNLADAYKELLGLICDIIVESDDVITPEEIEEVKSLKALF